MTSNGVRLEDVIRSGLRYPESAIGIYAPDFESYDVFRELFDPILEDFRAPSLSHRSGMACLNPAAIVSSRIRVARNLSGYAFPAAMSKAERRGVEEKIAQACLSLAPDFEGALTRMEDLPPGELNAMILERHAFGPDDKFMAAAGIHSDWPTGRSVFNTRAPELSVWINEEDHLRVSVVVPGANISACYEILASVMARLESRLDFCEDAKTGFLTSCPSNAGSAMRLSYRVDLRLDASQEPLLERLEAAGIVQLRGTAGEFSPRGELVDVGFRNRVGISGMQMLQDIKLLLATPGHHASESVESMARPAIS